MKLFEENDIFKILSEAISEGILIVNENQLIVASNAMANEMFGYDIEELNGKSLDILLPAKTRITHERHFGKFIEKGGKRSMGLGLDLEGIRKDGSEFPLEIGLNSFKLLRKNYVMALVIDISERKKAEQAINHWFRIFNESLNEIFVFDYKTFTFLNVNHGAQLNLGYSIEELKQMSILDIKPELSKESFTRLLRPLLGNKKEKIEFETMHQRKDGSTYPVEVHLQLSTIGKKQVVVAIVLDITERKSYTQNLERKVEERTEQLSEALKAEKSLNELKTKFLSLVSHEFKTPLTSILTSTALLSKYTETDQQEKRNKHIETIKSKVKHLNDILTDFLSLERLESGKVTYNPVSFPLSKLVNEVVYSANTLLKEGQRILYPKNVDGISITFDEKIMTLALSNLVHNAIKYSPGNTSIELAVEHETKALKIHVIDQGVGIPEEEQPFIFERYFRASNVLTTQGTGIGLNIAKQHLFNLGGNITFESEQGKGSIFTLEIPI
ncbi:PAS domain-containing sensor histidine kinase [Flagellimonas aquimarina]|uniref:histidine kinase n=1 Tax=Flagellimonas aquimarina TaxID=2201895 RepID=A0A316KTW2_9FLAO|nr:PAS domain-containing sensor histidine kinase [Allomuricauda koreensis]PWL37647.1 PAS domain-containing sensor histidine kinase [Allomuricauda koreensis]